MTSDRIPPPPSGRELPVRRQLVRSLTAMAAVIAFGVIGYTLLGFP